MLGFFSSRPNWDPTPSPAGGCVPSYFGWGNTLAGASERGGSHFGSDEETATVGCGSLGICYFVGLVKKSRPFFSSLSALLHLPTPWPQIKLCRRKLVNGDGTRISNNNLLDGLTSRLEQQFGFDPSILRHRRSKRRQMKQC